MASYIQIEFDRTRPEINIYAPRYTTGAILNTVTIESNEALSSYQEFYAIDSIGNKHIFTFHQESENTYVGRVRFNTMPVGLINLYARAKDEVDNISDLVDTTIEIKEEIQLLTMVTSESAREISDNSDSRLVESEHKQKMIDIEEKSTETETSDKTRKIEEIHRETDLDTI